MSSPGPGSDDGVSAAAAAAAVVVCCMCGDHGLPHELFRCNLCRLRTQHRYCSDLYPRVAGPYRSCNWCLKQQGGAAGGGDSRSPAKAPAAAAAAAGTRSRRINDSRGDDDDRDSDASVPCYGCSRSAFSADPGKPIKKPKRGGRERAVQRPEPVVTTTVVPKKRRREVQPGTPRLKAKVRRYKLLAEVIC